MRKFWVNLIVLAAATLLQWLMWDFIRPAPYLLYYPAVTMCALRGEGYSAIATSVLLAQYFFHEPGLSIFPHTLQDLTRGMIFAGSALVIVKITRLQKHERHLRALLVAAISHDLRNPLTAARTGAELLEVNDLDPTRRKSIATQVVRAIDRADSMVQDLLDTDRIRAGQSVPLHRRPADLRNAVSAAVAEASLTTQNPILEKQAGGSIEGLWDLNAVQKIIQNLISNAVKYGASGAPITVGTELCEREATLYVHNVADHYILAKQEINMLWLPYKRLPWAEKSGKRGWGLGLTLVKGLTQAMGGKIDVTSSREHGTTFTVKLPRIPVDSRPTSGSPA